MATDATPKSPKWQKRWLEVFRDTGNVRLACHATGIERSTAYRRKEANPEFADAWRQAEEDATDVLEAEARKRARNSSDVLLIFLLKSLRPDKYQDRSRLDVLFGKMPDDQLDAYIQQRLAEAGPPDEDSHRPPALPAGGEEEE